MTDPDFARAQIAQYRQEQAVDRATLAEIESGVKHFEQVAGSAAMEDVTEERSFELLAHIAPLEDVITLYQRDLPANERSIEGN